MIPTTYNKKEIIILGWKVDNGSLELFAKQL
jgi:hypothetical protein